MTARDQPGRQGDAAAEVDAEPVPEPRSMPPLLLALVALLTAVDIYNDHADGATLEHLWIEFAVVALATGGAVALWWQLQSARRRNRALAAHLLAARADAERQRVDLERYRAESVDHARGLGEAIDRQFERWELSPAEREVALLLLKGLSHKESAEVRSTSERTVRQQALAVYRKAGLAGRAELAAFFLEDLLQPPGVAQPGAAAGAR